MKSKTLDEQVSVLIEVKYGVTKKYVRELGNAIGYSLDEKYEPVTLRKKTSPKLYYRAYLPKQSYEQMVAEMKNYNGILEVWRDDAALTIELKASLEGRRYSLEEVLKKLGIDVKDKNTKKKY